MQQPLAIFRSKKIYYGWFVLAGSFIILFFNAICFALMGIMMKPVSADLNWSRSNMDHALLIYMIIHAISVPAGGKVYDRFGPKVAIILFSVFIFAGNVLAAFSNSFILFVIAFGVLIGIGMGGPSSPLMGAIICKWFAKYRGLAISLAVAGFCTGLFVLVPLTNYFVEFFSWRQAFLIIGVVVLVVNTLITLLIIKGDPKDFGMQPLGAAEIATKTDNTKALDAAHDINLTVALKTCGFWMMLTVMTVCGVGCTFMMAYFIPAATDYGVDNVTAGGILGLVGIYSLVGMLIAGPFADKFGGRWPLAICMLFRVVGFSTVLYLSPLLAFNMLALLMGLTQMATIPISNTVAANMFGTSHIGFITGIFTTGHHFGGAVLAVIAGIMFQASGNYDAVFVFTFVFCAVGVVASLLIREKRYYFEAQAIVQEK